MRACFHYRRVVCNCVKNHNKSVVFLRSVVKSTFWKCGSLTRFSVIWRKCWIFTLSLILLLSPSNSSLISVSETSIKSVLFNDILCNLQIIKQFYTYFGIFEKDLRPIPLTNVKIRFFLKHVVCTLYICLLFCSCKHSILIWEIQCQ